MKWTTHLFVILLTKFKAYMYCYHNYLKYWNCASQPSGTSTISRSIKVQILSDVFLLHELDFSSQLSRNAATHLGNRGVV